MNGDQGRYSHEAWERTAAEAKAEHPTRRVTPATGTHSTLVPGVVEMSLRGSHDDIERLITAMRDVGIVVWRVPDQGLRAGRDAGYQYFSVEVPKDARG